jgi:hypothetical protein
MARIIIPHTLAKVTSHKGLFFITKNGFCSPEWNQTTLHFAVQSLSLGWGRDGYSSKKV